MSGNLLLSLSTVRRENLLLVASASNVRPRPTALVHQIASETLLGTTRNTMEKTGSFSVFAWKGYITARRQLKRAPAGGRGAG